MCICVLSFMNDLPAWLMEGFLMYFEDNLSNSLICLMEDPEQFNRCVESDSWFHVVLSHTFQLIDLHGVDWVDPIFCIMESFVGLDFFNFWWVDLGNPSKTQLGLPVGIGRYGQMLWAFKILYVCQSFAPQSWFEVICVMTIWPSGWTFFLSCHSGWSSCWGINYTWEGDRIQTQSLSPKLSKYPRLILNRLY